MWKFFKKKSHEPTHSPDKKKEDQNFLAALVRLGFVTHEKAKECMFEKAIVRKKIPNVRVVDIMFKKGLIGRAQAEIAFEKIGRHYRFCPNCLQRYALKRVREGKHITCTRCRFVFEATDNVLEMDDATLKKAGGLVIPHDAPRPARTDPPPDEEKKE
jgi:hypothetical protein